MKPNCCVFVLCGVVRRVGDGGVRECRFSVNGSFYVVRSFFLDGNVQIV